MIVNFIKAINISLWLIPVITKTHDFGNKKGN